MSGKYRVWLSSDPVLARFAEIISNTSDGDARRGRFDVPDSVPHVRPLLGITYLLGLKQMRVPMPNFALGTLNIDTDQLRFVARRPRMPGSLVRGVETKLTFALHLGEIVRCEQVPFTSPASAHYDTTYTRLVTTRPDPLSDLLITAAPSMLFPAKNRTQSGALFEHLVSLLDTRGWAANST